MVNVYLYVCMYVCMYVYEGCDRIYTYVSTHIYVCMYMYIHNVCVYVGVQANNPIGVQIHICAYVDIPVYIYTYIVEV